MSDIAIKIENLSKQYRLGQVGTGTISHDLNRWWHQIRGKENPYLKIGEVNDRTSKGNSEYVWALKDIDFELKKGEILGVIGKNGAGKSTLLKLLSKVTAPTTGSIRAKGRIASLLEVGTGFHPEMTGRENIYMNGTIMGMNRHEISSKLDEIVDFAGVERYLDTPAKRYSSGMTVRLGFSIAAHLEPEILVVDEVLAVGDAEFQQKAIGKMQDVSEGEGRTVLFVSHNMSSISQLCNSGILLKNGSIAKTGNITDVLDAYAFLESEKNDIYSNKKANPYQIISVKVLNEKEDSQFDFSENVTVEIEVNLPSKKENFYLGVAVNDKLKRKIFTSQHRVEENSIVNGNVLKKTMVIPRNLLLNGSYSVDVASFIPNLLTYDYLKDICSFKVIDLESELSIYNNADIGVINQQCEWI